MFEVFPCLLDFFQILFDSMKDKTKMSRYSYKRKNKTAFELTYFARNVP